MEKPFVINAKQAEILCELAEQKDKFYSKLYESITCDHPPPVIAREITNVIQIIANIQKKNLVYVNN